MDSIDDIGSDRGGEDRRLAVQSAVARALSEAATAPAAARSVLESIGTTLGWRLGSLWEVDAAADRIRCVEGWHPPGADAAAFEEASRATALARGDGLPGRVWESGEPAWIRDVVEDPGFPRAAVAAATGVHGAFAFPIRSSRGVIGAIEFFTEAAAEPDAYLLDLMSTIGYQLGMQMERTRAEQAVRQSEARKAAMLEASLDCIVSMDHRGRVVEFNAAAERTFGYSADEAIGREMAELIVPPSLRERHREGLRRYLDTREPHVIGRRLEIVAMRADGSEFPVELTITRIELDGPPLFTGFLRDISDRKRREHSDRFLAEAGALLGASLDLDETLGAITRLAVPGIADWCAIDLLEDDGTIRRVAAAHTDPAKSELALELGRRWPSRIEDEGGFGRAIRTGEPELYEEIPSTAIEALEPEYRDLVAPLGLRSVVIVPLRTPDGRAVGALALVTAESGRQLDEHDVVLGLELGRRCAVAIDNARLYRERSTIAHTLQQSLLPPELPEIAGLGVAACFRPAGHGIEMGGDFYDVFQLPDGSWALVMGDVCGKGPSAAALTALARYTVRAVTMHETDPGRVLTLLNEAILRQGFDGRFCSAVFVRLVRTPDGARAEIACGGHPPPLVARAGGRVDEIAASGLLLGLWPDPNVDSEPVELAAGDSLILYTDGVTDARAPERILAPEDMAALLRTSAGADPQAIAERIERAVTEGVAHAPRDDIALLVVGVTARPAAAGDRPLRVELDHGAEAPQVARRALDQLAATLPHQPLEELKLLATELVTNSVCHTTPGAGIALELRIDGDLARIEVTDGGPGFAAAPTALDVEAESGRGLCIVDALADRWGVENDGRTRVWAELELTVAVAVTPPPEQSRRRS